MYKINSGINRFINGVIQNAGWILVIFLTILILVFTQLGTKHNLKSNSIHDVIVSYHEYGNISDVNITIPMDIPEGDIVRVRDYYAALIDTLDSDIEREQAVIDNPNSTNIAKLRAQERIDSNRTLIAQYEAEIILIRSGVLGGLNLDTWMTSKNQEFTWIGEYELNRVVSLVTTDVYSWVMSVLLAVSGIVIKIQGVKTGKMSGLKLIWKTTLRHATLSEKISPYSKQAEAVCEEMNQVELFTIREKRLSYVALKYDDVFTEEGKFRDVINFVKPQVITYKTLKGKTKYREDKYQKKLLKRQRKVVEKLKTYYPVEIHIHNLLETKQVYRERFDLGKSIEQYEKTKNIKNVIASIFTITPMIASVSIFVYSENTMNLIIGIVGTIINVSSLLTNMFASYAFITESYQDALIKKCDLLLQIGNQLRLTDEKDNNWNTYIEEEEHKLEQQRILAQQQKAEGVK